MAAGGRKIRGLHRENTRGHEENTTSIGEHFTHLNSIPLLIGVVKIHTGYHV